MAKILSSTGIQDGSPILPGHITQSINAFNGSDAYEITISGSLVVTGSATDNAIEVLGNSCVRGKFDALSETNIRSGFTASGLRYPRVDGASGSVLTTNGAFELGFQTDLPNVSVGTASFVATSSYALNALVATTASYSEYALSSDSSSYTLRASTASYIENAVSASHVVTAATASYTTYGTGSFTGSFSGSFVGDGSQLTNIPTASQASTASYIEASNITGSIPSSSFATTASHIQGIGSGSFSGSFVGNGSGLTNLQAPGNEGEFIINSNDGTFSSVPQLYIDTGSGFISIGVTATPTATLDVFGRIAQRGLRSSVVIGESAMINDVAGCFNVAIGRDALSGSSATECTVAIGFGALSTDTSTNNNIGIGHQALSASSGDRSIAIGTQAAGLMNEGDCNIGIGYHALRTVTNGGSNIALGNCSLEQVRSGANNIGIGHHAGLNSTGTCENVLIGNCAGVELLTGQNNVFLGTEAGECINGASLGNVVIGHCAGPDSLGLKNNTLYINNDQSDSPLIYGEFGNGATLNINGTLTASGIIYPSADASSGSVLTTDGEGRLVFKPAAMFATDSSAQDTGSFYNSSSISASVIEFNQGDGTTETITLPDTSSYALMALTASYAISSSHEISYDVSASHSETADTASHAIFAITASHALNGGDQTPEGTISSSAQIFGLGFVTSSATASFLTGEDTGSFVTNSQTGSFLTGADTSSFVVNSQTGSFVTNSQTGSFVTSTETGSFVTNSQTGSFVTSTETSSFVTNSQTGSFVTNSDTSSFVSDTGSFFTGSTVSDATLTFQLGGGTTEVRTINNVINAATASYVQGTNVDGAVSTASYVSATNIDGDITATTASYILGSNVDGTVTSASHAINALTASYALNAGSSGVDAGITGSSLVTASISGSNNNFIEFTKGDDSSFVVQLDASIVNGNSFVHDQTVSSSVWNVNHGIGTSYPSIEIFNADNEVVLPQNIEVIDANNVRVTFPVNTVGHAAITTGGGHPPVSTGSFYISSSVNLNTITFNQGDGTTDQLTVDTGSGGGGNVNSDITASSLVTASISGSNNNFIEFEKGNGDTFALQIDQSVVNGNSYVHNQTVSSSTWNVTHNIGTSYPAVTVFNDQGEIVLPQNVEIVDANSITVTFPVSTVGDVSVTTGGGHTPISTGSFYISSSVALNELTFTQGDGTTEVVTIHTGSGGGSNITIGNDGDNRVVTANGDGTISGSTDFTFDGSVALVPTLRATTGLSLRTPANLNDRRGFQFTNQSDARRGGLDLHVDNRIISVYANSTDGRATTLSSRLEIDGTNETATFISASLTVSGSTDISGSLSIGGISDVSASIASLEATNDTGSLLVTASLSGSSLNVIEFEKGDGTTFDVEINSDLPVTQSFTNTNTFDIVHGFSSKAVAVSVYGDNDRQIIPQEVELIDDSTARVTFSSNFTGYGVVTKGGLSGASTNTFTQAFTSLNTITATHNFNQRLVIVQVYDDDYQQVIPQEITLVDVNTVRVNFSSPQSGNIIIKK